MNTFGYSIMNESWFATERDVDVILVYKSPDYGVGVDYEFTLKWKLLQGKPTLQLAVFEDALIAFKEMHQLFAELAVLHETNPQKADIVLLLNKLGYKDTTKRENPDFRTGSFCDPSARYYAAEKTSRSWGVFDKKSGTEIALFNPQDTYDAEKLACNMSKILNSENK